MAGRGRPSKYTRAISDKICARLATGETLRAICRDSGYPQESTVRNWALEDLDGFFARYTRARVFGADSLFDGLLEIAYTTEVGEKTKTYPDGKSEVIKGDMIEHRKLKVDAIKWYIAHVLPKRYGVQPTDDSRRTDLLAEITDSIQPPPGETE